MKLLLKIIIPLLILLAAFGIFKCLETLKPPIETKPPGKVVPDAEIIEVSPADHSPPVLSFGTVQPHFETVLTPQVSGRIDKVAEVFRVGSLVEKGTLLARIDATDYQAALAREQAGLETAKRTHAEEEIRAKQAADDWVASGRELSEASDFVLRKPQLAAAKASIASAQAAVDKANADILRTEIRAPYNAVITERSASEGNLASPQSVLGRLVSTELAEIRLPLTGEQASRVELPLVGRELDKPIKVVLTSPKQPDAEWSASIVRTEPTIDPRNQVTFAIAELSEPYAKGKSVLAVGAFVNASIEARPISNTLKLPESALINDAWVWALDKDNKLFQLNALRLYSLEGNAYIRLKDTDATSPYRIVLRPLTNFRDDMKVKPVSKVVIE